jgi:hypothetical protein
MSTPFDYGSAAAYSLEDLAAIRDYQWPSDVYDVTGTLRDCALAMERTLTSAWSWLQVESLAGRVGHDELPDNDPGVIEAVQAALTALEEAEEHSRQLAEALDHVRQITSHLTGV